MADQELTFCSTLRSDDRDNRLDRIVWSQESLPLSTFVGKYKLPQIVKVEEGYYGAEDESSLSTGQLLKVHCIQTSRKVTGKDRVGNEVHIPLNTLHRVNLRPRNYKVIYSSVLELAHAKPLPKFVEITQGYYNVDSSDVQELSVEPGEKLEVGAVEILTIRGHRRKYMTFTSLNGVEVKLPFNCMAGFKPLDDLEDHLISEVVKTNEFPIFVQFLSEHAEQEGDAVKSNALVKLGVLKLEHVYSEELIIASCGHNNTRVVFTIPKSLAITVKVALGTLHDDPVYEEVCKTYNDFSDIELRVAESHETDFSSGPGGLREYEYEYLRPQTVALNLPPTYAEVNSGVAVNGKHLLPAAVGDAPEEQNIKVITFADNLFRERGTQNDTSTQSSLGSTETLGSKSSILDVDPYSSKGDADDELEYEHAPAHVSKTGFEPGSTMCVDNQDPLQTNGNIQLVILATEDSHQLHRDVKSGSINGINDQFEAVTIEPTAVTFPSDVRIMEARNVVNTHGTEKYNASMARMTTIDTTQSDSTTSDTDDGATYSVRGHLWNPFGPNDLRGMSAVSEGHITRAGNKYLSSTVNSDSELKNRSRSLGLQELDLMSHDDVSNIGQATKPRSLSNPVISSGAANLDPDFSISKDLSTLDLDDVCRCLRKLNLGHLEETFRHNQINGGLLVFLDDESLKDLQLSSFERRKILNFIQGWRPDK